MKDKILRVAISKDSTAMRQALKYDSYIPPNYDMTFMTEKKEVYRITNAKWFPFIMRNKSCLKIADIIEDIFSTSALVVREPLRAPYFIGSQIGQSTPKFVCGLIGINAEKQDVVPN